MILLELINIYYKFNKDISDKYKPYSLSLYSDYINNDNIQKCHLELLNNTKLKTLSYENYKELLKGLDEKEYHDFLSFLDNLEETGETTKETSEFNNDKIKPEDNNNINNNNKPKLSIVEKKGNNEEEYEDDDDKYDINNLNSLPDVNSIEPNIHMVKYNDQLQNSKEIRITAKQKLQPKIEYNLQRNDNNKVISIGIKKKPLGYINGKEKNLIKEFLRDHNYKQSEDILKLYTCENEQFYANINKWLFSYNILIYREIGPIVGKLINFYIL